MVLVGGSGLRRIACPRGGLVSAAGEKMLARARAEGVGLEYNMGLSVLNSEANSRRC